jgi:hypothetical protein
MPSESVRTITIAPDRLERWLTNFGTRHGPIAATAADGRVEVVAEDGATAAIAVPFPPLAPNELAPRALGPAGNRAPVEDSAATVDPLAALLDHLARSRRVGAVLARKGGFAVGVFDGPRLVASKVGSAYVQGKTKAGGWSQQRYARRRDNQSRKAYVEAADEVVRVLLPHLPELEAVATGGDRSALAAVFADPRLTAVRPLLQTRVHPVPDPRLRVLQAFPEQFLAVEIDLNALA